MTQTELKKREAALKDAGYHKSRATSSTNDYSWFKTIKDPAEPEEWLYMIEWRVWDWSEYINHNYSLTKSPYSMELCTIVRLPDSSSARMVYPDGLSIEDAERLAKDFYEFIISRYKSERESCENE